MHFSVVIFILHQIFDFAHGGAIGRIFGGYRVDISQVPYTVHTQYLLPGDKMVSNCGGSILTGNLILTAAHCIYDTETMTQNIASRFTIRAGSTYKNSGGQTYKATRVFEHPQYAANGRHHDVGIIQLSDQIQFDRNTQLTQLAKANDVIYIGADTVVNGWGRNPDHPDDKENLYQVHLRVVGPAVCAMTFGVPVAEVEKRNICVNGIRKSACQGDSGGALVDTRTGRQIGIVSYGAKDCSQGFPNVFSKVQDNLDFINSVKGQTGNKDQSGEADGDETDDNKTDEDDC